MRTCRSCGETKDIEEFPRDQKAQLGRSRHCNRCACKATTAWREKNRERYLEAGRARYRAQRESRSQYGRRRYMTKAGEIKDRVKQWRRLHPEAVRIRSVNRLAKRLGLSGRLKLRDWMKVVEASGGRCHYCGQVRKLEMDHVYPMSRGGPNVPENLVAACRRCNSRKSNGLLPGFAPWTAAA